MKISISELNKGKLVYANIIIQSDKYTELFTWDLLWWLIWLISEHYV